MHLSRPVAFQKPAVVARFVLDPVGYLRSLWLKKYHSFCGADPIRHLSASIVSYTYTYQQQQSIAKSCIDRSLIERISC
jgi:hypothetical protein